MVYLRIVNFNQNTINMSDAIIPDVEITSDVPEKKSLAELVGQFEELVQNEDRMKMSKEVEAIKAAFYRTLAKERAEAENPEDAAFAEIENAFKDIYNAYKKERSEYNKGLEKEAASNLELKKAVIEDLKALVEAQEEVNETFPKFREIQERWRNIGTIPQSEYRNINETYQLYVEQFFLKSRSRSSRLIFTLS